MANLEQIKSLNKKFGKPSPIANLDNSFVNEALDSTRLQKAFSLQVANLGPNYTRYFDYGLPVESALLFIDVCDFSTRFSNLNGSEIAEFFNQYYNIVIPILYKYGGEVDKIIGDGIVCVFAPPFLNINIEEIAKSANDCAVELIAATRNTKYSSKVAVHNGVINYFKNESGIYNEFTIIGKPLTELFRLESASDNECINFYQGTRIYNIHSAEIEISRMKKIMGLVPTNFYRTKSTTGLNGVDFQTIYAYKIIQR